MDPALSSFMNSPKRQATNQKLGSLIASGKDKVVISIEVAPISPVVNRKRGQPSKAQADVGVGQSSIRKPSMISPSLQLAQAVQFNLLLEDEGVLAAIPTRNFIEELVKLQSRSTVVSKALGEELKRTSAMLVPKLRTELAERTIHLWWPWKLSRRVEKRCGRINWWSRKCKRV